MNEEVKAKYKALLKKKIAKEKAIYQEYTMHETMLPEDQMKLAVLRAEISTITSIFSDLGHTIRLGEVD